MWLEVQTLQKQLLRKCEKHFSTTHFTVWFSHFKRSLQTLNRDFFLEKTSYKFMTSREVPFILRLNHKNLHKGEKTFWQHWYAKRDTLAGRQRYTPALKVCVRQPLREKSLTTFTVITPAFMSKNSLRGARPWAKPFPHVLLCEMDTGRLTPRGECPASDKTRLGFPCAKACFGSQR